MTLPEAVFVSVSLYATFFALFLLVLLARKDGGVALKILWLVFACGFVDQVIAYYGMSGEINKYPFLFRLSFPFELALMPLLYIYFSSMVDNQFSLKSVKWWNFAPMLFGWTWYLFFYFFAPTEFFQTGPTVYFEKYLRVIIVTFIGFPYFYLSYQKYFQYRAKAKLVFSCLQYWNVRWLGFLLAMWFGGLFFSIMNAILGPASKIWLYTPSFEMFALGGLSYFALRTTPIISKVEAAQKSQNHLSETELEKLKLRLLELFKNERPYLKVQLRLDELAKKMNIKSYRLSEVLRRGFQTNFYDFINGYRVKEAKRLLQSSVGNHFNLTGIAFEAGFNSRSSFNEVFRAVVGVTPSEFQKRPSELALSGNQTS